MAYCSRLLLVLLLLVKREADLAIALRKFVYQKDMSEYCRRRVMPSVFLGRQVVDAYSQILHFSRLELPYSCFVSIRAVLGFRQVQYLLPIPPIVHIFLVIYNPPVLNRGDLSLLLLPGDKFKFWKLILNIIDRTESGSNIILVIQLMSDKNLIDSCQNSKNQLLVYEIGETFGGYWGALPDNVMKQEPPPSSSSSSSSSPIIENRYVLKTTPRTTTTTTIRTTELSTTPSTTVTMGNTVKKFKNNEDDFIVEVPLVNVSAILVPGKLPSNTLLDEEESFDSVIDVKPKPGVRYSTKVLPLVQFAILDEDNKRRTADGQEAGALQYEVDLNADLFTPDARLSYPLLRLSTRRKHPGKYKYNANSRLDFKKNKNLLAQKEALFYKTSRVPHEPLFDLQSNVLFTRSDFIQTPSQKEKGHDSNPFEVVDAILKNLSKTKDDDPRMNIQIDKDVANLLHGLAKIGHNETVFLVPNASWYALRPSSTTRFISTKYSTGKITWRQPSASYRTNYLEDIEDTSINMEGLSQDIHKSSNTMPAMNNNDSVIIDIGRSGPLLPLALDVNQIINVTQQNDFVKMEKSIIINPDTLASEVSGTSTTATTPETVKPMTLVDHESWENMVQAASLMAVMLNQSVTSSVGEEKQGLNVMPSPPVGNIKSRKKRYMHAIPIEHAKPHHLPVNIEIPSSTVYNDKISDAQEFQRLIELQDDEIHDRVALRYLRQYVGPALFNICDFDEAAARHVYLFNSSRLVLAITNFTLERMTVVMTPARTLLRSDARCAPAHLECQVSGARVCIDSLSACDGVPNCGSYDIYDEDRLTCGGSIGLQHNVCLAAVTFLAVLLTILYTVHYWLKRCVPKVSDAFFIYTDAAENVLYLDPIMRSPHDTEDAKDIFRIAAMPGYLECPNMHIQKKTVGSFFSRLTRLFRCKREKKLSSVLDDQIIEEEYNEMDPRTGRFFSFAEVELSKMGSPFLNDVAVQTGESLEFQIMNKPLINERTTPVDLDEDTHYEEIRASTDMRSILDSEMLSKEPSDELSLLNFFKRARSVSVQLSHTVKSSEIQASKNLPQMEEKEIQCLEYDYSLVSPVAESDVATTGDIIDKKPDHGLTQKKLRFEEEMTTIQVSDDDDALEEEVVLDHRIRRSVVYGGGKNIHPEDTGSNSNVGEPSTSTNREFKSYFWGSGKNKPKKTTKKKTQQFFSR